MNLPDLRVTSAFLSGTFRSGVAVLLLAPLLTTLGLSAASAEQPRLPPVGVDFDYQLGGNALPPANVGIVVRDRTARVSAGNYNICYVNAFQTQPTERRIWRSHPRLVLRRNGHPVVDEAWGEKLLDIRTRAKRRALARIVGRWIDGCAAAGYDAVEFDNLDSYSRSDGLIKRRHTKKYAARLVRRAHRAGLAVGQKNRAGWNGRKVGFDFAIAEECGRWSECGRYVRDYGRRVLVIEYRRRDFVATCAGFGDRLGVVLRDRDLSPNGVHQWC
jgi:Glycoside-hydrolase family GH114